jgi:hypothetical protein
VLQRIEIACDISQVLETQQIMMVYKGILDVKPRIRANVYIEVLPEVGSCLAQRPGHSGTAIVELKKLRIQR